MLSPEDHEEMMKTDINYVKQFYEQQVFHYHTLAKLAIKEISDTYGQEYSKVWSEFEDRASAITYEKYGC